MDTSSGHQPWMRTMCLWLSDLRTSISRNIISMVWLDAVSRCMRFTATERPCSQPRYTTPNPPRPISRLAQKSLVASRMSFDVKARKLSRFTVARRARGATSCAPSSLPSASSTSCVAPPAL
jgi:hypothetical protein